MKILVTGGKGQLAYELIRLTKDKKFSHHEIYSPSKEELNISDFIRVAQVFENFRPDIVINTAAYTQVDRAQTEIDCAFATNFHGAKNLAIVCKEFNCALIHLSTDYIFDGSNKQSYIETDPVAPLNIYGESKWQGEEYISRYCNKYIILRVSAVFGSHGNNFVKTILKLAKERDNLSIVADQVTCPTPAADIARILLLLCDNPQWGIFNYCGAPATNWYQFAEHIIKEASQYDTFEIKKLNNILTCEYPTPAKRPLYSVLNCQKFKTTFGIEQPSWELGLKNVIRELYSA